MSVILDFLYTPYGLGTLAGSSVAITSLLWIIVCCSILCCRKWLKKRESGSTSAEVDLKYVSVAKGRGTGEEQVGTSSSGYNSRVDTLSHSVQSLTDDNGHDDGMIAHSSLDNIITPH